MKNMPEKFDCIPREIIERDGKPFAVRVETVDTPERGSTFETLPITGAAVLAFSDSIGEAVTAERYKYRKADFFRVTGRI